MKEMLEEILMNEGIEGVEDYLDYVSEYYEIMEEENEF